MTRCLKTDHELPEASGQQMSVRLREFDQKSGNTMSTVTDVHCEPRQAISHVMCCSRGKNLGSPT